MSCYIDIGANLTNKSLMRDIEGVLKRATASGIEKIVVTGTSFEDSKAAIELCKRYPEQLVCTAGVHPHHASDWTDTGAAELESLIGQDYVRAVGETGLDFNRNFSPRDIQIDVFHQQLAMAIMIKKPVFTHQREAHGTFVDILRQYRNNLKQVVIHCFTDNKAALDDYLELDCHIGITGWICDERRGLELQQLVKYIPKNRLMVETDAPYLLPRDLKPKPKSRINEPAYLPHILQNVARHRGVEQASELATACLSASRLFFNI